MTARRTVVVQAAASKRDVLVAFGEALGFPAYYRPNLDAFNDCLQDLASELANDEGRPVALEWHVHPAFRELPAFVAMREILADAVEASCGTLTLKVTS
ncbi:barstar family protein [Sinomonas flava]|uniref:barstar family protein n=1 Tax=Sinomonas flava TaxID=496857 RepID=UPI0039A63528